ncbi:PREDICTED: leukocyte-associated immunoglobulin-like receptor 2 isoform X1 [Myotis brandtii]|uniref:leukocyte-associated immunoglobulin-like receptor 2 isoform X1 n=1 Tax=Myotis brandtii TaxID=109478 RepID=UPI000703DB14|nr:PREDICTED: leukocyte-associated immunoglobulin-like receptor 2 isoform X1 [Myotis brandtii]
MSPRPSTLLGLVLCLGQTIHMQEGVWPKPSLRVQPGPVVPRGRPVTLVCRGPAGAELFRLEKDGKHEYYGQKSESQDGWQGTKARFHFPTVSEDMAGRYRCRYHQDSLWSEHSEPLELKMTEEDSTPPSGGSQGPATCPSLVSVLGLPTLLLTPCPGAPLPLHTRPSAFTPGSGPWSLVPSGHHSGLDPEPRIRGDTELSCWDGWGLSFQPPGPASRDYTVENSIRLGLAGVVLLILVVILVEAGLSQRRAPQGPQE